MHVDPPTLSLSGLNAPGYGTHGAAAAQSQFELGALIEKQWRRERPQHRPKRAGTRPVRQARRSGESAGNRVMSPLPKPRRAQSWAVAAGKTSPDTAAHHPQTEARTARTQCHAHEAYPLAREIQRCGATRTECARRKTNVRAETPGTRRKTRADGGNTRREKKTHFDSSKLVLELVLPVALVPLDGGRRSPSASMRSVGAGAHVVHGVEVVVVPVAYGVECVTYLEGDVLFVVGVAVGVVVVLRVGGGEMVPPPEIESRRSSAAGSERRLGLGRASGGGAAPGGSVAVRRLRGFPSAPMPSASAPVGESEEYGSGAREWGWEEAETKAWRERGVRLGPRTRSFGRAPATQRRSPVPGNGIVVIARRHALPSPSLPNAEIPRPNRTYARRRHRTLARTLVQFARAAS
ncbi:hypothetical protein FB451DRAFT_1464814 [Mycena latifolia]|nr:hypothetical protein FB451DRAFT_1464814 [Mycena latifolia]